MDAFKQQLEQLSAKNQYRSIPDLVHQGRYIMRENRKMLNMSSNVYQFFISFINGKFSCLYRS